MKENDYPIGKKTLITVSEFCISHSTGRTKAYALIASGQITAVKRGRSTLLTVESVQRWASSLPRMTSRAASSRTPEAQS